MKFIGGPEGFSPIDSTGMGVGIGFYKRDAEESDPNQYDKDRILVWTENGRLKVSVVVRDSDGKILAKMVGNEFFTMPRPAIFDRNYDDNNLEVVDAYGNLVLQVSMVGPCAEIVGVFHDVYGLTHVFDNNGYLGNPDNLATYNLNIDPIFVHPCEGHLGERIKK